ncbi:TPA: hypothetical protein NBH86_001135 [Serratia marcescens]|nr:hypothetical protein [Serratia marcescens]
MQKWIGTGTVRHLMCKKGGQPMNIIFTPCWLKFGVAAKDYTQQLLGCGGW